jgi:hypothetical protein
VVLLPSAQSSKLAGGNPFLSFDDSLTLTADLLRRQLTAPPVVQSLGKNGYRNSYQVVDDPLTAGPVLDITVTGNSKNSVEHTLAGVTTEAGRQLLVMQGHVAPIDRINLRTVSYAPQASLLVSKKARTPVVALAVGLVLTLAVPLTIDAAIADRRKTRSRAWSPRSAAKRAATMIAAAGSLARAQLIAKPSTDGQPGTGPDGASSGATRSWQPNAADRVLADDRHRSQAAGRPTDGWHGIMADPGLGHHRTGRGRPVAAGVEHQLAAKQDRAGVPDEQRVLAADAHGDSSADAAGKKRLDSELGVAPGAAAVAEPTARGSVGPAEPKGTTQA